MPASLLHGSDQHVINQNIQTLLQSGHTHPEAIKTAMAFAKAPVPGAVQHTPEPHPSVVPPASAHPFFPAHAASIHPFPVR